jgi:hypothetical protein
MQNIVVIAFVALGAACSSGQRDDASEESGVMDDLDISDFLFDGHDATFDVMEGCGGQDAVPAGDCTMELPGVRWNGNECVYFGSGCSCSGPDCDELYPSIEECLAAHVACVEPVGE